MPFTTSLRTSSVKYFINSFDLSIWAHYTGDGDGDGADINYTHFISFRTIAEDVTKYKKTHQTIFKKMHAHWRK